MGETVDLGSGYNLEARAPVGLLTRNILIRGSNNTQWADAIPACPDGFNPGKPYFVHAKYCCEQKSLIL